MINFVLPNFYFFRNLNNRLLKLQKDCPHYFYNISFSAQEGNFPYSYWSDVFTNKETSTYKIYLNFLQSNNMPIHFNCANPLLQINDLDDASQNAYLKIGENGSNSILISSYLILNELKTKYPQYHFIGSEYYIATDPELKYLNELQRIKVYYKNVDILNKIPKNKTEIVLNDPCEDCNNKINCLLTNWENIYEYSSINPTINCTLVKEINCEWQDIEKLSKQGYQFFSLNVSHISLYDIKYMIYLYVKLFIKPEYKKDAELFLRS